MANAGGAEEKSMKLFRKQNFCRSGFVLILAAALSAIFAFDATAEWIEKNGMSLSEARKIAAAAETEARKNNWNVVIAIVDEGGNLVYLERMDESQVGSIGVAVEKAKTAINFKRPTKMFEEALTGGEMSLLSLHGVVMRDGGFPIALGGKIVGAIGVSGATSAQDGRVAKAGADSVK
jgi:uncharacterized protein GlcG (DUF336 family)